MRDRLRSPDSLSGAAPYLSLDLLYLHTFPCTATVGRAFERQPTHATRHKRQRHHLFSWAHAPGVPTPPVAFCISLFPILPPSLLFCFLLSSSFLLCLFPPTMAPNLSTVRAHTLNPDPPIVVAAVNVRTPVALPTCQWRHWRLAPFFSPGGSPAPRGEFALPQPPCPPRRPRLAARSYMMASPCRFAPRGFALERLGACCCDRHVAYIHIWSCCHPAPQPPGAPIILEGLQEHMCAAPIRTILAGASGRPPRSTTLHHIRARAAAAVAAPLLALHLAQCPAPPPVSPNTAIALYTINACRRAILCNLARLLLPLV